ncbi:MAG: PTS transporter subunit EIIA [Phycisphaerae bacterium]|nr:PTS transporter subunit EIIA [Phycisphaerae bacterium]
MFENYLPVENPVLIFALLLLIALAAPLLSAKLKTPGIIGLIVTGIVLGPYTLGVLERSAEIQLLGEVGLLYIMFLAGLELDRNQFIRHRNHSFVFGGLTFIIPLVVGSLMGRYILSFSWSASVLLASLFSSHTLITFPIVSRLGLVRQRAVTTAIGGTIITDTAALLVLAVIAAFHQGQGGWFFWPRLFLLMLVYGAGMIVILPRLARWFFRNIVSDGIVSFTGVLAAVFIGAYLAYAAGLEPIIGAFLVGLLMNSFIPEKSALMNRIQFVGHSLFIPFFLISVGMLVNVRMFYAETETLLIAAVMVFAALVTKWAAAYPTQRLLNYSPDEGKLIFGLSVNQAAATLAAVLVGYNIGIFAEPVLTGAIVMILVTILAGSWTTERYARRVAIKEEAEPYHPSEAPPRVLVPLANPEAVATLMGLAILIRQRNAHEPIYPLTIALSGDNADARIAAAEKLLGHAVVQAIEADVPVTPVARTATDTLAGVVQATVDLRISTIVAGWKGESTFRARTFGRTLDAVLDNTTQMMFIARCPMPLNTTERVVLVVPPMADRQPGFVAAVKAIKTLAHQFDALLLLASASPTMDNASRLVKQGLPKLQESDVELNSWKSLPGWLAETLEENDLLVMVSVRKGRLAWQPDLNRLPRLMIQQFPNVNHIFVYPPDMLWGDFIGAQKTQEFHPSFLPAGHIQLDLEATTATEAIYRLLSVKFLDNPTALKRVSDELVRLAETEPTELLPGIVLVHTHIPDIYMPAAFLGINKSGWTLPNTTAPVQALFILLSPQSASPEMHLKTLADLIRPMHTFKTADQLTGLDSVEDILNLFYGGK